MTGRTNHKRVWLPWIVAFTGVLFIYFTVHFIHPWRFYWRDIEPWENATLMSMLIANSALKSSYPFWILRIGALVGIVGLFVIGPALWIFGETKKSAPASGALKPGISWYAGAMILIAGFWYAGSGIWVKIRMEQISGRYQSRQHIKNELRNGLMNRAIKAVELYYLPSKQGGGGGSFRELPAQDGRHRPINEQDLEASNTSSKGTYVLGPVQSDSVITIYAVGDIKGGDAGFKNANGEKGKYQLAVRVNPSKSDFIDWYKNQPYANANSQNLSTHRVR